MDSKRDQLRISEKGGMITVGRTVVTTIAQYAAARTLGAASGVSSVGRESRREPTKAKLEQIKRIRVDLTEDQSRPAIDSIEMAVVLHEGQPIPTVAAALQRSVKETVENMTGFPVSRVNLEIRDIVTAKKRGKRGSSKASSNAKKDEHRKKS